MYLYDETFSIYLPFSCSEKSFNFQKNIYLVFNSFATFGWVRKILIIHPAGAGRAWACMIPSQDHLPIACAANFRRVCKFQ